MEDAFFPYIFFLGGGDMMDGEGSSSSPKFLKAIKATLEMESASYSLSLWNIFCILEFLLLICNVLIWNKKRFWFLIKTLLRSQYDRNKHCSLKNQ
jgi:hypothetical protein